MGWKGVKEGLCALEKNKTFFCVNSFHFIRKSKYSSPQLKQSWLNPYVHDGFYCLMWNNGIKVFNNFLYEVIENAGSAPHLRVQGTTSTLAKDSFLRLGVNKVQKNLIGIFFECKLLNIILEKQSTVWSPTGHRHRAGCAQHVQKSGKFQMALSLPKSC